MLFDGCRLWSSWLESLFVALVAMDYLALHCWSSGPTRQNLVELYRKKGETPILGLIQKSGFMGKIYVLDFG